MRLVQIIYMSSLACSAESELPLIVAQAMRNNSANGLTGMLLFADGNVVQVLEGERETLRATFAKIEQDPRHTDVFVLTDEPIEKRHFSQWSMGYRHLSPLDLETLGKSSDIFKCSPKELQDRVQPCDALAVLLSFASGSMGFP